MTLTAIEKVRHENSLQGSAEFARQVRKYMRENRISRELYEQAAREYREKLEDEGDSLLHVATFGAAPEETESSTMSWQEADSILSDLVKKRIEKGESFDEAYAAVFSDPSMSPVVEVYLRNS